MTPLNHFSWMDPRRGDIYNISLDDSGDFLTAERFIEHGGRSPITYTLLSEIPQPHRDSIEDAIIRHRTKR